MSSIIFNDVYLASYNLTVTQSDINEIMKRGDYTRIKDRSITYQSTREPKTIRSKIVVEGANWAELNSNLDLIKKTLDTNTVKRLVYDTFNDRYFLAKLERFEGLYRTPKLFEGSIQFICPDPIAFSRIETSSDHSINADPKTVVETTLGSATIRPMYQYTSTDVVGAITFKLENLNTSEELVWTDTIAAAEVLEIDCENWTVELDGVSSMTNVSGQFPTLEPSVANSIKVTAGNAGSLNITYRNRYL